MLLQEIRYACRMLAKSPGFTIVAALSIALGIGVNTALFSFHDAILLRPLPVREPKSIVTVNLAGDDQPSSVGRLSYPNYRDLRDRSRSFDGLLANQLMLFSFAQSRQAAREMRMGMLVNDNFFAVLGVQPMLGRPFTAEEGKVPGRDAVIVLGFDFWKNALGGDSTLLNSIVIINGIDFNVIGVAPESFTGLDQFVRPSFYIPLMMTGQLIAGSDNPLEDRKASSWDIRGRLRPGVSVKDAESELTMLWKELELQYPDINRDRTIAVRTELEQRIRSTPANAVIGVMMTTLAALVLIIACANVANLMFGRARSRSREVAIRLALGVNRMRLLRQLLTESLVLALLGGALGVGLAYGGIRFLAASAQSIVPTDIPVVISPELDSRVLVFSLAAAVASAALFGVAPAWQSLKVQLAAALKSSELGETRRRLVGRNLLVSAQIALSIVLLVAAGMVQAGFQQTLALDPGFRTDHLMTMALDTSFARYTPAQTHNFYRNLVDRVRVLPGVQSVALTDALPLDRGFRFRMAVIPEGYQFLPGTDTATVTTSVVDESYFRTMKTEIVRGRAFTAADNDRSKRVVIVNETFAAKYWPNQDSIGKRIQPTNTSGSWLEVVGIAKTEKYANIIEQPTAFIYLPFAQQEKPQMTLLVESVNADASSLAAPLREIVRTLDVNQPVFSLRTFASFYQREATGAPQLVLRTASAMGLLGLTLALVGLYGLISYRVDRRTREIGIRMAIGAGRASVVMMVLKQGMKLAITGILAGALTSIAVTRLLAAGMAGLGTVNTSSYVVVPIVVIGLTLLASYIPASRASKIDPLRALRHD